jgi:hypothetical protein
MPLEAPVIRTSLVMGMRNWGKNAFILTKVGHLGKSKNPATGTGFSTRF